MKNLTAVLCLDDRGGMTFNERRQSRDRLLIKDLCDGYSTNIYIESYSLPLFSEYEDRVEVCCNPIADCPDGGMCFIELIKPELFLSECAKLIIYRWNRTYPFDMAFDNSVLKEFKLVQEYEFVGSSHEKITKGVFER